MHDSLIGNSIDVSMGRVEKKKKWEYDISRDKSLLQAFTHFSICGTNGTTNNDNSIRTEKLLIKHFNQIKKDNKTLKRMKYFIDMDKTKQKI